jgi:citrate lyase subunit beta/citryl-CoA lyase
VHTIERLEAEVPGRRRIEIMGGIESMQGVIRAVELCAAHPRLRSVYFGAEDFASDIGARRTPAGDEVLYARSQVVLAARASGLVAIDQAVVEIRDDQRCRDDAAKGRDLGYQGKICVVPRQVDLCNELFAPTPDEVAHARALISAYEDACARGLCTIDFNGKMIAGPLLQRAQAAQHLLTSRFKHASGNPHVVAEACVCSRQLRRHVLQMLARSRGQALRKLRDV